MGNQGHCSEGYRRLCEYVWAGAIGKITETHSWTDRANGGAGPRPPTQPVPAGMHWDEWIGPAPYRDYHKDLHPHEWHGWYDFGNGSLGNMACHVMDGVYWALKIEHPDEHRAGRGVRRQRRALSHRHADPLGFPGPRRHAGREGLLVRRPYGGQPTRASDDPKAPKAKRGPAHPAAAAGGIAEEVSRREVRHQRHAVRGRERHHLHRHLRRQHAHRAQGENEGIARAAQVAAAAQEHSFGDFLAAVREGRSDTAAGFDYSTRLTEFMLLGNLAQLAGVGKRIEWDGPNMKVKNLPELNRHLQREYRKGWEV